MFFLYQVLLSFLLLISPLILIFRFLKKKENKKSILEKFCLSFKKKTAGKIIWFHGSSVGELLSIIPLIENYEKNNSIDQILVTSSTLSSSKVLSRFNFKKTIHQFYPVDHIFFTKKFLNYWKPDLAIFIESEIWPCMFKNLNYKKIPLILLNARITEKTFLKWKSLKNFQREIFNKIMITYPQNIETKSYLKKLNVNKIKIIGNLKFAQTDNEKIDVISNSLKSHFKSKKIWVASSTHFGEEVFCAKAHLDLKKKIKNLVTVIIPRHIHRTNEIISELENLGLKVLAHSSKNKKFKNLDIYIVDTFGETKKFHKIGCSVFLGGSIINRGGQNPLEAARYGAKILHGPNIDNFKDVYKTLSSLKISKKVFSINELASQISFKRNRYKAEKINKIGRNILKETIKDLDKHINNEIKKT